MTIGSGGLTRGPLRGGTFCPAGHPQKNELTYAS